jgi:transcriptional regulator with GAF, ATPase, and Fis domain
VKAFGRSGPADQVHNRRGFAQIIGKSPALETVLEQVERVATTDSTVLIEGETGTGKELIASSRAPQRKHRFARLLVSSTPHGLP